MMIYIAALIELLLFGLFLVAIFFFHDVPMSVVAGSILFLAVYLGWQLR